MATPVHARIGSWLAERLLGFFVILFFVFLVAPIAVVVAVAFTSANFISFPTPGFSLRWFVQVFEYRPFVNSLIVSIQVAVGSAILGSLIGVPAALKLSRTRSRIGGAVATFLISPLSMPAIVLGFSLLFYLSALGLPLSFASLLIAHTVVSIPYIMRTVIGVYRSVPTSYEEAARALGANRFRVFVHVTLPIIRPGIFAGCLFAMLVSIDNLPLSYFFGSTASNTLPVVVLSYLENQFDPAVAAISVIQLTIAIVLLVVIDMTYGLRRVAINS